jgi:hypothetical protein
MKLTQLCKLFDRLPAEMVQALGQKDFSVCWYGCSGLDFRLVREINKQKARIGVRPNVFFYTDSGYTGGYLNYFNQIERRHFPNERDHIRHLNFPGGWDTAFTQGLQPSPMQRALFTAVAENPREARIIWFQQDLGNEGPGQFIILVDCPNQLFERTAIEAGLQFEIVCEAGGMSNHQRPLRLGDLGANWSLGHVPEYVGQGFIYQKDERNSDYDSDPCHTRVPFYSEHVIDTDWGVTGSTGFPLRKIIRLNPEDYPSLSMATAVAIEHGRQHLHDKNGFHDHILILDHLKSLSPSAAKSLIQNDCSLSLDGLELLDPEIARILASHKGSLYLNGLEIVDQEIAHILAPHNGSLGLGGLKTLSSDAALALAPHAATLYLGRINDIDADTARALAEHTGPVVIREITNLNDEIADHLGCRADISIGNLTFLTPRAAASLTMQSGELKLDFVRTISPEIARALSSRQGRLSLDGLEELSTEVAETLARHQGTLSLDGVKELSSEVAEKLAQHQGTLSLSGIKTLDPDAAKHLSKHRGVLFLNGIEELSHKASKALMGNSVTEQQPELNWRDVPWNYLVGWNRKSGRVREHWWPGQKSDSRFSCILVAGKSPLIDLHGGALTKEIAALIANAGSTVFVRSCSAVLGGALEALTNHEGKLVLDGSILSLSNEAADYLTNYPGNLSLPDYAWKKLNGTKAKLLRKLSTSRKLDLKNVESLSEDAVRIVSAHPGGVYDHPALHRFWDGLTLLDDTEKAKLIAAFPKRARNLQRIALGKVREISDQCAEILAATRGPLYLNALKDPASTVLKYLAKHRGSLSLGGIRHLARENAAVLAEHRGALLLNGIESVTSESLNLLSHHVGMLSLNGVTLLNEGCAEIISSMIAPVSLKGVREISDHDAELLAKKTGYQVRCRGPIRQKIQWRGDRNKTARREQP